MPEGTHDARRTQGSASQFLGLSESYVMYRGVTPLQTSVRHPHGAGGSWVTPSSSNNYRTELSLWWQNRQVQPDETPPSCATRIFCWYSQWIWKLKFLTLWKQEVLWQRKGRVVQILCEACHRDFSDFRSFINPCHGNDMCILKSRVTWSPTYHNRQVKNV